MIAVVVGLALLVSWHAVRVVLELTDLHNPYVVTLSIALVLATHVAIGIGAIGLARRHRGLPRAGAWLAAGGHLAIAATTLLHVCLVQLGPHSVAAARWDHAMFVYGWYALAAIAITGFAIAAGRPAAWLGPPAIGCVMMQSPNPLANSTAVLAFGTVVAVIVAVMAIAAERRAAVPAEDPARAASGLRGVEVLAWLAAAEAVVNISFVIAHAHQSIYVALPWGCMAIVLTMTFAIAAWSIARAAVPGLTRWPWYLAATCSLWGAIRYARSWFVTVVRHWGHLDEVKLVTPHWSVHVPTILAMVAALFGVAMFARRRGLRELALAAFVTGMFVVVVFSVRIAIAHDVIAEAGCYLVANIAAARIYRRARSELAGGLPPARTL